MIDRFTACIVAAGQGERAGAGEPKQFRKLAGKPMVRWSLEAFNAHPACEAIVLALSDDARDRADALVESLGTPVTIVGGGAERTGSVEACLACVRSAHLMIHDAARPGLTAALIDRLLEALATAEGAAPVLAVTDALARRDTSGLEAVSRDGLLRVQTPQAFSTPALKAAFASRAGRLYPDEVSLARAAGLSVVGVDGTERNFKVTWPQDFERMSALLQPGQASLTVSGGGFDVHRLAPGSGVTLCGVFIACPLHLVGHSDADAGLHAITDALLGAAGLGDIGEHFPPSDPQWRGADSAHFLTHALKLAREANAEPVHVDVTLICERPKIGPYRDAMRARVAELTGLPRERVNIKATTTEKLGFTGRGEGLAAEAIVTVRLK